MNGYGLGYLGLARTRKFKRIKRAGVFIISAAACMVLLLYVSQRVRTVELGYEVETLKSEVADLSRTNELLGVEVATLSSPSRIEDVAGDMLGMSVPRESQVVVVRELRRGGPTGPPDNSRLVRKDTGLPKTTGG